MIEVFKTNVQSGSESQRIIQALRLYNPMYNCNFDLQDDDRILRVVCEGDDVCICDIISIVRDQGYDAEVLPDEEVSTLKNILLNRNC